MSSTLMKESAEFGKGRGGFYTREQAERLVGESKNPSISYGIVRQRQYLAEQWLYPHNCPNCGETLALVDAQHIEGDLFQCAHCPAKVFHTVPLVQVGPVNWEWSLAAGQIG